MVGGGAGGSRLATGSCSPSGGAGAKRLRGSLAEPLAVIRLGLRRLVKNDSDLARGSSIGHLAALGMLPYKVG